MPTYTYRREDGTTFDIRQSFSDSPLTTDPQTGQHVERVMQAVGVIFKGSGFYINDSKSASKSSATTPTTGAKKDGDAAAKPDKAEAKSEKAEAKGESAPAAPAPAPAKSSAAAD